MTHQEAAEIMAVERYLLGEMTEQERGAFEAHYFDCAECAEAVREGQIFSANARAVFKEQEAAKR